MLTAGKPPPAAGKLYAVSKVSVPGAAVVGAGRAGGGGCGDWTGGGPMGEEVW